MKKVVAKDNKKKSKEISNGKTAYIYVGDNVTINDIFIAKNTILCSLEIFEKAFEKDEKLKELFINIKDYAKIKKSLSKKHNQINKIILERRKGNKSKVKKKIVGKVEKEVTKKIEEKEDNNGI